MGIFGIAPWDHTYEKGTLPFLQNTSIDTDTHTGTHSYKHMHVNPSRRSTSKGLG